MKDGWLNRFSRPMQTIINLLPELKNRPRYPLIEKAGISFHTLHGAVKKVVKRCEPGKGSR
jgi:hypothetical protein